MLDVRPVGNVVGWLLIGLGAAMLIPLAASFLIKDGQWINFVISSGLTMLIGSILVLATFSKHIAESGTSNRQTFLITICMYVIIPLFGALPFIFSDPGLGIVDAYFEAVSGLTTTGATVYVGLEKLPKGILLWRGLLQWVGGILIIIIAMTVLPRLRVGGMQFVMERSYQKLRTVMPDAITTARGISIIYMVISILCFLGYSLAGLSFFDSVVHTMTTVATGGFGNYDTSFQHLGWRAEYVAIVFMAAASIPFIQYVEAMKGSRALFTDSQIRAFLLIIAVIGATLASWQILVNGEGLEHAVRKALFNSISIMTGTGYTSADYNAWGSFPIVVFFLIGLIGGCAGSTSCSIKVFRYQLLVAAIIAQIRKIITPNAIIHAKIRDRNIPTEILASVIIFFALFIFSLFVSAVLLAMTGLDFITSMSGSAAALGNIGPGLGEMIGPTGNYQGLNNAAKIILSATMVVGRLEFLAVYVILSLRFWWG